MAVDTSRAGAKIGDKDTPWTTTLAPPAWSRLGERSAAAAAVRRGAPGRASPWAAKLRSPAHPGSLKKPRESADAVEGSRRRPRVHGTIGACADLIAGA